MFEAVVAKMKKAPPPRRPAEVGWAIQQDKAGIIWDNPRPYQRKMPKPQSAKSVQGCPAAIDFDARHIVVDCPVDLHLRVKLDDPKGPQLINVPGPAGTVRGKHLNQMVSLVAQNEWRHPQRPIIQVMTPYIFITDEPIYMSQVPAYLDYHNPPMPGLLIGGRFPLEVWPRHMMWAFEWYDITKDLILRRGQPWFYIKFETMDPSRPMRLVEADVRPEVQEYINAISSVTNYVNRTFSLFDRARARRPERLLYRKERVNQPFAPVIDGPLPVFED